MKESHVITARLNISKRQYRQDQKKKSAMCIEIIIHFPSHEFIVDFFLLLERVPLGQTRK